MEPDEKNVKMVTRAAVNSGEAERKKMKENKKCVFGFHAKLVDVWSCIQMWPRQENLDKTNTSVEHGEEVSHQLRSASRAIKGKNNNRMTDSSETTRRWRRNEE